MARILAVLIALAATVAPGGPARAAADIDPEHLCPALIAAAEQARGVPRHLLLAIALAESGRTAEPGGTWHPWPWTVMAEGKGRYFPSKRAALDHIAALQARGVGNIDVGCMQVNLHFHGVHFASPADAIDPVNNVAYATAFLVDLRRDLNSWTRAVKHYHSATMARNGPYRARVYDIWRDLQRNRPLIQDVAPAASPPDPAPTPVGAGAPAPAASPAPAPAADPPPRSSPTHGIAQWPPRDLAQQRRAETLARVKALTPR